jgi:peroxiredoxin
MLEAGASAPQFSLKAHTGEDVSLEGLRGKWVVLHTYPLAFTGG